MEYKWFILLFWTHKLKSFSLFKNTSNTSFNSIFFYNVTVDVKKFSFPPISNHFEKQLTSINNIKKNGKQQQEFIGKNKMLQVVYHQSQDANQDYQLILYSKEYHWILFFNWMRDGAFESCLGNYSTDFISIICLRI